MRELARIVGAEHVRTGAALRPYLHDATESRGVGGSAEAAVLPADADQVAEVVRWCRDTGTPLTPRGGGTGFAGGCVPQGGIVLSLERLRRLRSLDAPQWRMQVEAGLTTAEAQRLARESGLFLPPNPGAAEQSQIGGNVATNAGGPRAFKYGVMGAWVMGVEAVLAGGEVATFGGPVRKDVAGYDLTHLLVGSEGTLGVITAVWLRLIPAPAAAFPVVALYPDVAAGCAAISAAMTCGPVPSAIEYLDGATLPIAAPSYPGELPRTDAFMVLCEVDGDDPAAAAAARDTLVGALREAGALDVQTPEPAALWRWRDGVSLAVTAKLGGKVSEDIAVPIERLGEAVERTLQIGARHDLRACSWGHAGDGNLHSTFLLDARDPDAIGRAHAAAEELFALAVELGGTITGEHGIGLVKGGRAARAWSPATIAAQEAIKRALDPAGLLNPGKKRLTGTTPG